MKNLFLIAIAFIAISSQASAWDSTISQIGGIVSVNGQLLKDSKGDTLGALSTPIASGTNGSETAYWGGLPVDYFNVTPANAMPFNGTPVEIFSPFFYYIPTLPTPINRYGGLCIVTNGTEYRAIISGLTYIPGEGTQVAGCYEGSDFAPMGTIPSGFRLLQNGDGTPTPPTPPPFQPIQENISGLSCDTYSMPDMSSVSWYSDFGSLANRDVYRENDSIIQTGTGASTQNLDVMAIVGASSGATLPLGSLSFTGTAYADIADIGASGKPPAIYSWLKRDGSIAGWNVINIRGVNTSGFFGKYGIFEGKAIDGSTSQKIMYSTGGIAESNLYNNKVGTTWQVFGPVSGFSGVRVGYAPYTQRKSCKLQGINSCEWKIEGGANVCGPVISQNFEVGVCAIAGSGSLYGSGSCVPVVDNSGKVVDAGILPGEGTILTLPDGSTKLVRISQNIKTELFACPNSKDEPWYKYLFSCGGEVIGNIFNKVTGATTTIINSQVGTFSNERLYTGSFTGMIQNFGNGTNPLVGTGATTNSGALFIALRDKLDTVGQPGPEIWQKMFTGGIAVGLLLMILSILGIILSAIRDRSDISSKK